MNPSSVCNVGKHYKCASFADLTDTAFFVGMFYNYFNSATPIFYVSLDKRNISALFPDFIISEIYLHDFYN